MKSEGMFFPVLVAASKNRLAVESLVRVWTEISHAAVTESENILYVIVIMYTLIFSQQSHD